VIAQGLVPVCMMVVLLKDEKYRGVAGNTALQYSYKSTSLIGRAFSVRTCC
jgi:hypothetical protein